MSAAPTLLAPDSAARSLPFTAAALLAPMEGVTEPCFRDLVLALPGIAPLGKV